MEAAPDAAPKCREKLEWAKNRGDQWKAGKGEQEMAAVAQDQETIVRSAHGELEDKPVEPADRVVEARDSMGEDEEQQNEPNNGDSNGDVNINEDDFDNEDLHEIQLDGTDTIEVEQDRGRRAY